MSLVKLLGFACVDGIFRQQLYNLPAADPSRAGFYLHPGDAIAAKVIFYDPDILEPFFNAVANGICTRPTCYAAANLSPAFGAMVLHEALIDKFFADPIGFLNNHGFPYTVSDLSVLDNMLHNKVQRDKLKGALYDLAHEINRRVDPLWKSATKAAAREK